MRSGVTPLTRTCPMARSDVIAARTSPLVRAQRPLTRKTPSSSLKDGPRRALDTTTSSQQGIPAKQRSGRVASAPGRSDRRPAQRLQSSDYPCERGLGRLRTVCGRRGAVIWAVWEQPLALWDSMHVRGVRAAYVASCLAAKGMVERGRV
jgi:hypothetical protein